jgi:N-dimethylarginine dimethylaminohydrolase
MLSNEGDRLKRVIVSTPHEAYFDVTTHRANNIPEVADPDTTRKQHDALKGVMAGAGCEVVDVAELPRHPNSVFPRDVALNTPEGYIQLRVGLEARRGAARSVHRKRHLPA